MQTANNKITKASLGALMSALTLLLMVFFSQAAQALLLQIDPERSEIHSIPSAPFCLLDYASGELDCPVMPPPQRFTMTGNIDVSVIQLHGENFVEDLLYLRTQDLSTDALEQGFHLGTLIAPMSGESFQTLHTCLFFPGWCSGLVLPGSGGESNGTWDGRTLTWNGYLPLYFSYLANGELSNSGFNYTIVATAVPEPGTLSLMLLMLSLMFFGMARQNRGIFSLRGIKR